MSHPPTLQRLDLYQLLKRDERIGKNPEHGGVLERGL
jgi:hypothetical protein